MSCIVMKSILIVSLLLLLSSYLLKGHGGLCFDIDLNHFFQLFQYRQEGVGIEHSAIMNCQNNCSIENRVLMFFFIHLRSNQMVEKCHRVRQIFSPKESLLDNGMYIRYRRRKNKNSHFFVMR